MLAMSVLLSLLLAISHSLFRNQNLSPLKTLLYLYKMTISTGMITSTLATPLTALWLDLLMN